MLCALLDILRGKSIVPMPFSIMLYVFIRLMHENERSQDAVDTVKVNAIADTTLSSVGRQPSLASMHEGHPALFLHQVQCLAVYIRL